MERKGVDYVDKEVSVPTKKPKKKKKRRGGFHPHLCQDEMSTLSIAGVLSFVPFRLAIGSTST